MLDYYDTQTKLLAVAGVALLVVTAVAGLAGGGVSVRCLVAGIACLAVAAWRHYTD